MKTSFAGVCLCTFHGVFLSLVLPLSVESSTFPLCPRGSRHYHEDPLCLKPESNGGTTGKMMNPISFYWLLKNTKVSSTHTIHVYGIYIYTYIWLKSMVNVGKYTILIHTWILWVILNMEFPKQ